MKSRPRAIFIGAVAICGLAIVASISMSILIVNDVNGLYEEIMKDIDEFRV
jgi:hypothetical protein